MKGYNVGYRLCDYREWVEKDYVLREEIDPYDFSVKRLDDTGFWTSSDTTVVERDSDEYVNGAWMISMSGEKARLFLEEKQFRHPIRCVKDE